MAEDLFKVIFKLEGDNKALLESLSHVNSKFAEQNDELKKQQIHLKTLQERETALMRGREASQNPTAIAKYNKELEKNKIKIDDVKKSMENLIVTEQKAGKATDDLNKKMAAAFDGTKVLAVTNEVKKLNEAIKATDKPTQSIRSRLRELKEQLATTDDDEEFLKLSIEAGKLEDKINDVREAAMIFATSSPFVSVSRGIKGVVSSLLSLDFQGAANKSKLLSKAAGQITFKASVQGIKDLGITLLNTGKALLLNPIFLLGAAVTAIIANFDKLKEMGGPVGAFFRGISKAIDNTLGLFAKLTDAIGLTTFAFDDMQKRIARDFERNTQAQMDQFDRAIRLAQALGKITDNIEKDKQRAIIRTAELQLKPLQTAIDMAKKNGQVINEDAEIRYQELKKIVDDANTEIQAVDNAAAKRAADKEKEKSLERLKIMQDFLKDRAELEDFYRDRDTQVKFEQHESDIADQVKMAEDFKKKNEDFDKDEAKTRAEENAKFKNHLKEQKEIDKKHAAELAEQRKQQALEQIDQISQIANATINASNIIINAKIQEIDKLSSLQEKRVNEAKEIADKGNAQLFELEQKRLDDLNQQREQFVKRQQALATIELIANTAIAVSKAAAQGGVAAAITIAAALIALTGGLIQARSIASQAAYYEGGYTGDGDPKQASTGLGRKPYTYHKGEFVFDHKKTGKYKDIFQDIHAGNIDLIDWKNKVSAFEAMKMFPIGGGKDIDITTLENKLNVLILAVEGQSTSVNFDENGLSMRFRNIASRNEFIKNHIARA